jgi:hypothetical protein
MKSTIARLAFALALPSLGCLADSADLDGPARTSAAAPVAADEAQAPQLDPAPPAQTNTETIVWRCPGSSINYATQPLCKLSCSVNCSPRVICTDSHGAPILCP